jgi:hypothetical protein
MSTLLSSLTLSDGSLVRFEMSHTDVPTQQDGGEVLGGPIEGAATMVSARMGDAVSVVQGVLGEFKSVLAQLEVSELEVEFGVSLSAEAGWFVGKAGGEASLTIRAKVQNGNEQGSRIPDPAQGDTGVS